jgi:hypothetical protein
MRTSLSAFTLTLGLLAGSPATSAAFWNSPQTYAGFGFFPGYALHSCPKSHFHGPLYNYGPYYPGTVGYQDMFVQNPYCGAYVPAWPSTYTNYGTPQTQWHYLNPALINAPDYAGGTVPEGEPAIAPAGPIATEAPAPTVTTAAESTPATVTPASFRPFRGRFQR